MALVYQTFISNVYQISCKGVNLFKEHPVDPSLLIQVVLVKNEIKPIALYSNFAPKDLNLQVKRIRQ